jgi:hypothetical protein
LRPFRHAAPAGDQVAVAGAAAALESLLRNAGQTFALRGIAGYLRRCSAGIAPPHGRLWVVKGPVAGADGACLIQLFTRRFYLLIKLELVCSRPLARTLATAG